MRRRWYYFKRMLQADRLFVAQMIGNIIRMIQYAGRWIVLAVVCVAALYLGRGVCAGAWKDFYENYAVRIADDVVRGFLPAWKEDEGTAFYLESRKNGSMRRYLGSRMRMGCCGQNGSQTGNKIREFTEMIVGRMHGEAEMRMKMHKTEQKQKVQKNGGTREKAELEKTDHPRMKRRHSQVCSQQEPSTPEIPASF